MSPTRHSTTSHRRRAPRRIVAGFGAALLAGGAFALAAAPAGAHVSPDKSEVEAGGYTDILLGVGHGCEVSPTTKLEVQIPEEILNVTPYVIPGWTVTVTPETLDTPVEGSHGEQVTERDAVVTWTAEAGRELPDGYKMQFGLSFQVPDVAGTTLLFPTIQTCQEGTSDWIEVTEDGQDEPEYPAPAVDVVEGSGDGHGGGTEISADGGEAEQASADGPTPISAPTDDDLDDDDDDSDSSNGLAIAGLVAGLGGLGLGGAAFAKSRKQAPSGGAPSRGAPPSGPYLVAVDAVDPDPVAALVDGVLSGHRRTLARAITLVESTRPDHRADAARLLDAVLPHTGRAVRIGISGPPGVGKSTFIEAVGSHVTGAGHRLAVLAVDPTSSRTGGSILGDKTRMETLARNPDAFIRPSPSGGELGGVARRTREAGLLCEAAGFDVVLIETVGVGQSELAVADLVDLFVLLASPSGGDDLQGIKRGIMELADVVVVTKADSGLETAARHAAADLRRALHLMRPKHDGLETQTLLVSSPTGIGIAEVWEHTIACHSHLRDTGQLDALRARQARAWMWDEVRSELAVRFRTAPAVAGVLADLERDVDAGRTAPTAAAQRLLDLFTGGSPGAGVPPDAT